MAQDSLTQALQVEFRHCATHMLLVCCLSLELPGFLLHVPTRDFFSHALFSSLKSLRLNKLSISHFQIFIRLCFDYGELMLFKDFHTRLQ